MKFNLFVGVDWSGAKGSSLKELQAAAVKPGQAMPETVDNPRGGQWNRTDLLSWVRECHRRNGPTLFGFDFAFTYPYLDTLAYFPGHPESPDSAYSLWALVDRVCRDDGDFHGRTFFSAKQPGFWKYLNISTLKGDLFDNSRLRQTEAACVQRYNIFPTSVFNCVGPASVGIGSIAGMRVLHKIWKEAGREFAIWPFQEPQEGQSVITEIYPRLFLERGEHYRVGKEMLDDRPNLWEDTRDALVGAAALRNIAEAQKYWEPRFLTPAVRRMEGWIFGVE